MQPLRVISPCTAGGPSCRKDGPQKRGGKPLRRVRTYFQQESGAWGGGDEEVDAKSCVQLHFHAVRNCASRRSPPQRDVGVISFFPARREESNRVPTGKPCRQTMADAAAAASTSAVKTDLLQRHSWVRMAINQRSLSRSKSPPGPGLLCPTEKDASPVYSVRPRTDGLSWGRPSLNEPLFADHLGAGLCPWNASWARKSLGPRLEP